MAPAGPRHRGGPSRESRPAVPGARRRRAERSHPSRLPSAWDGRRLAQRGIRAGGSVRLLDEYVALDLTDLRGQLCGKLLRDLGMAVVKVEPPDGDPVRRLGPFAHDRPDLESSLRFAYL